MSFRLSGLQPGDILLSKINELYVYIGFYEGKPSHSYYEHPDSGYLYIFIDRLFSREVYTPNKISEAKVLEDIPYKLRGFDGFARYTKNPVTFEQRVGHVDISTLSHEIRYAYGMRRLGDLKPKGYVQ